MKDDPRSHPFRDSTQDVATADRIPDTAQTRAPAYRLAFTDTDFMTREELRPVRLQLELLKPQLILDERGIRSTVVLMGSARIRPDASEAEIAPLLHWYEVARDLARLITEKSLESYGRENVVITGGGPGIMEAANRGASEAGAESVGLNIQLPMEQRTNSYVKHGKGFYYFFTRKVMMSASSQAYLFFPGGFGTLDELIELVTLIQTGKMASIPIVLIDRKYWEGFFGWIRQGPLASDYIKETDLDIVKIVDTAEEAFELVKDSPERPYF